MEYHGIEVKQINLLSHSGHAKPLVGEDVLGAVVCNDSGQHLEAYGRFFVRKMKPTDDCSEWRSNSLMETEQNGRLPQQGTRPDDITLVGLVPRIRKFL